MVGNKRKNNLFDELRLKLAFISTILKKRYIRIARLV